MLLYVKCKYIIIIIVWYGNAISCFRVHCQKLPAKPNSIMSKAKEIIVEQNIKHLRKICWMETIKNK